VAVLILPGVNLVVVVVVVVVICSYCYPVGRVMSAIGHNHDILCIMQAFSIVSVYVGPSVCMYVRLSVCLSVCVTVCMYYCIDVCVSIINNLSSVSCRDAVF